MTRLIEALTALLIVSVGVLAWQFHLQTVTLADQSKQIRALDSQLAERSTADGLEQQEKCAQQPLIAFRASGLSKEQGSFAGYETHYNQKLIKSLIGMTRT